MRTVRAMAGWIVGVLLVAAGGPAAADICRSIQAELAQLPRGPSARDQQTAARAQTEANRIWAHMRSIGCERQGLFIFGAPPPPECPALRGRLYQLQQQAQVASGAQADLRRRQLMSLQISHNCRTVPDLPQAPRGQPLVAGIYDQGGGPRQRLEIRPDEQIDRPVTPRVRSLRNAVCVRLCDGFFFPVQGNLQQPDDDPEALCRSACPAAETRLFITRGDDIANAVSLDGESYGELDHAFRYRRSYDATCTCRRGTRIGNALEVNPDGAANGAGFGIINPDPDIVPELEDPGFLRGVEPPSGRPRDNSVFGSRKPPEPPAPPHPPVEIPADRLVPEGQGEMRESTGRDGARRSVRVIAPELSPAPSEAAIPSAPARAPVR